MAKIMVIAGGEWQCPIVKTAKKMGHYVICSNLYENSPAFQYADVGEVADVLDKEKNLEIAKKYVPDAILTDQSDVAVPTVAYVAEMLGRKGIGEETSHLFTNKYAMRTFCEKEGFPFPRYRLCHTYEEAEQFLATEKKAILKPLDNQSSRGIYIVENKHQLKYYFEDTLNCSHIEKAVLIEQYIEGTEFTVDGIKSENSYFVTAISQKKPFLHNPNVAKELLFSNYHAAYDYDELRELNRQMVLKTRLPFGLTHAEYKYMNGKFYLIEMAARGGGTKISSDLVPVMSGINSNELYINMLLGKKEPLEVHYDRNRYAILSFFDFRPGKTADIQGLESALHIDGVRDIRLHFHAGDTLKNAENDSSRSGHYIISADSYQELRIREKEMLQTLKIRYEGET